MSLLTPQAQAQSLSTYQAKIEKLRLWQHPQWLKLGHYRKNVVSGYESPIKGDFFISPEGKTNPRAELEATVKVLFSAGESKKLQCRYLARTRWLQKVLDIEAKELIVCPERDRWKAELGAEEIFLVFASSDLSSAGSSFGHTFLRLHNPKNQKERALLDYGVNYAASTGKDSGAIYALKGVLGFYPGVFSMLPYHQKLKEYSNVEGRDIWEYKLDFAPEEVLLLIDHLLELEGSYADYYFTNDNCAQQILELLEVGRPQINVASQFWDVTIPLDTVKILALRGLLVTEEIRPSLRSQWEWIYSQLSSNQKSKFKEFQKNLDLQILRDFSAQEQAQILEATLSYLAIEEYRSEKDFRQQKYLLSVHRAKLGAQTEPTAVPLPASPLTSPESVGIYLGGGEEQGQSFYRFKYRRAFHDLLSDDSGLTPFSHLEFLGLDFRYYRDQKSWDLNQMTLLKILSTNPVTAFATPISWSLDAGTAPRFVPYLHFGVGFSADLGPHRVLLLLAAENDSLSETARNAAGLDAQIFSKFAGWRTQMGFKALQGIQEKELYLSPSAGISRNWGFYEFRAEGTWRRAQPEWMFSVVF